MANTELILPRLQELSLEELRRDYRFFLQAQGLSRATVTTSCYDTFYLFRHEGHDVFWRVILSTNFEAEARTALLEAFYCKPHHPGQCIYVAPSPLPQLCSSYLD